MRRFRFGRKRSFRGMVQRARPIVRAATGTILAKRFIANKFDIPDVSATDFDNPVAFSLAECLEAQDEELESDGTNIATVPLYSRLVSIKANLFVTAGAQTFIRWVLLRNPDADLTASTIMTEFHTSDESSANRELRKNTLAKGYFALASDRLQSRIPIFIRRKAIARVQSFRENDRLTLVLAKHADGTDADMSGFGTCYFKANG